MRTRSVLALVVAVRNAALAPHRHVHPSASVTLATCGHSMAALRVTLVVAMDTRWEEVTLAPYAL